MAKEAKARIRINDLLHRSGWRFGDAETGPANISLEPNIKIKNKALDALGQDFEQTANGFMDYLLLDDRGFPVAILEAKAISASRKTA
jgi:type I restriction enzyme R subunit